MSGISREQQLASWFADKAGVSACDLAVVSGDASFRRYFRTQTATGPVVLVDSPPAQEKNAEFVAVAQAMTSSGLRVPQILHHDLELGFFALEDFGDALLLPLLSADTVDHWYQVALDELATLAVSKVSFSVPRYDRAKLVQEMQLFRDWLCVELLGLPVDNALFDAVCDLLSERAEQQFQIPVHRDFHARNLMCLSAGGSGSGSCSDSESALGVIDFQDAVVGPVTYDPVSLLKDCYIRWPESQVEAWALAHRERLITLGLSMPEPSEYLIDFHWMGLQRHIKVLGIFIRLYLRDGKTAYLGDLPTVVAYVRSALKLYQGNATLAEFSDWIEADVFPALENQDFYRQAQQKLEGGQ